MFTIIHSRPKGSSFGVMENHKTKLKKFSGRLLTEDIDLEAILKATREELIDSVLQQEGDDVGVTLPKKASGGAEASIKVDPMQMMMQTMIELKKQRIKREDERENRRMKQEEEKEKQRIKIEEEKEKQRIHSEEEKEKQRIHIEEEKEKQRIKMEEMTRAFEEKKWCMEREERKTKAWRDQEREDRLKQERQDRQRRDRYISGPSKGTSEILESRKT